MMIFFFFIFNFISISEDITKKESVPIKMTKTVCQIYLLRVFVTISNREFNIIFNIFLPYDSQRENLK